MEISVSLWTPRRTGVDPISLSFSCFLVPQLVPHGGRYPRPEPLLCPRGPSTWINW